MLAKGANDNAGTLNERGACSFFASKLAPTVECVCKEKPALPVKATRAFAFLRFTAPEPLPAHKSSPAPGSASAHPHPRTAPRIPVLR
ncbi:hypothetical protein CER19_20805 [Pseudomonas sp. GL93]|nr:hypothetical protein CER19_20805 [Pseudomonas sp. GL93]